MHVMQFLNLRKTCVCVWGGGGMMTKFVYYRSTIFMEWNIEVKSIDNVMILI